ncbi:MAG: hypothetical protein U1E39_17605 [Planctomycetota bacterium]
MSSAPAPSRLPFLLVGLLVGAAVTFGLTRLGGSPAAPTPPPAATPDPAASRSPSGDRAPQLAEGTFTVWGIVSPGNEQLRAIASRALDGTEVWVMAPSWIAPSSSATDVSLRVKYESASTFLTPQDLLNWAGTKPAIRPLLHGQNLTAFVHDTVVVWNGSVPRYCNP